MRISSLNTSKSKMNSPRHFPIRLVCIVAVLLGGVIAANAQSAQFALKVESARSRKAAEVRRADQLKTDILAAAAVIGKTAGALASESATALSGGAEKRSNTAPAQSEPGRRFEIEMRFWFNRASANAGSVDEDGGPFVLNNFAPGLKGRNTPEARLTMRTTRRGKLRIDFTELGASGDASRIALGVDGENFEFASGAVSDLKLKQLRIGYAWQVINIRDRVKIGPLVEARLYHLNADITFVDPFATGGAARITERDSFTIGLPSVGLDLNILPHRRIDIFATASGVPAREYGHLLDAELGVKYSILERLNLIAGYRYWGIHAKYEGDFARFSWRGPMIGAGFKF
jgi:hypothetical protein